MNIVQETEIVYTWYDGDEGGQIDAHWQTHRIQKRTKEFFFVLRKIGRFEETVKLRRRELEEKGEIYWTRGRTLCECFYTEEGKKRFDQRREAYRPLVPECLKALGLTRDATVEDVKRAYRELALKHHPDTGGNHDAFLQLGEHYNAALRIVQRA